MRAEVHVGALLLAVDHTLSRGAEPVIAERLWAVL
jgi:hypothetical protein